MNNLKQIEVYEYETRSPKTNTSYFDNLTEEGKGEYLSFYALYSNWLYQFLIEKLDLKKYDDMLEKSENKFFPISLENMDFYQGLASSYLKYFYIRNNLYIERLTSEEQEFLRKKMVNSDIDYNDEVKIFILETYQKVMLENLDEKVKTSTNYGPDNYSFIKPTNAIIIGIRFDDYHKDINESDSEWIEHNNNRLYQIELLINCFEAKFSKILNIPCYVIKYNDFSINKVNSSELKK